MATTSSNRKTGLLKAVMNNLPGTARNLTAVLLFTALSTDLRAGVDPIWQNLSSKRGQVPMPPGGSTQQTGALVGDFDGDGVDDFILSFRQKPPALVWYRRTATGWDPYVIEKEFLPIEAGGAAYDIDGDGDLDVVFGGDYQSDELWWWENPSPHFDPNVPWKRHLIKKGGKTQHHDQVFGDFLGTGKAQLVFWNQQAKTLFLAEIPKDPRAAESWPLTAIATNVTSESEPYPEGLCAFDIDGDRKVDIVACDSWYKHLGGKQFKRIRFADQGGRVAAGYLKFSKTAQIVVSSGDGNGPLRWYACAGDPEDSKSWVGHDLAGRVTIHAHSLQLGDIDRDGNLDIFCAEMAKWHEDQPLPDNPEATAWVFYGDGQGHFDKKEVVVGHGWHEARLVDLDGDGDLDLLNKPYDWDTPRVDVWLNKGTRAGAKGVGTSASFHGPVGLQLYTLRDVLAQNVGFGLQCARNFGFREVELAGTYGVAPEKFHEMLGRFSLKAISGIFDYDRFVTDPQGIVAEAKALGLQFVGIAGMPHDGVLTEKECRQAAAAFNISGRYMADNSLKFFYHPHGFEFVPHGKATLFDLLVAETKPELVAFELDVFWAVHAGQNPVKLLRTYPDRWVLMHLKDLRQGVKTGLIDANEDSRNDVPLGSGQVDVPAVLQAASQIGVKHYFIEDESPSPITQIPQSVRYLESLAW